MTSRCPSNEMMNELVAEEDSPRREATPGPSSAQRVLALRLVGGPKRFDLRKQRYENGTLNFIGITCLHESLSTLLVVGMESIEGHILDVSDRLISKLEPMWMSAYVAGDRSERAGIISIRVPDADEISRKLAQARIEVAVRQGFLRVPATFTTPKTKLPHLSKT